MSQINKMKLRYNVAKDAAVGSEIICPGCGCKHIKSTYNKTFCSNQKSKGNKNCKDKFWNTVDPEKRCRNTEYFREVIMKKHEFDKGFGDKSYVDEIDRNGNFKGRTSEGYRIFGSTAYDEWGEKIYEVDSNEDDHHSNED